GAEHRDLDLHHEVLEQPGVDEFRVLRARHPNVGKREDVVDLLGEKEADDERDAERDRRLDQPGAQLDQVLDQRRLGGLDVLVGHAARSPPAGGAAAGSLVAVAGSAVGAGAGECALSVAGAAGGGSAVVASARRGGGAGGAGARGGCLVLSVGSLSAASFRSLKGSVMPAPFFPVASSMSRLMSAISASRMASRNWSWNSPAMRRILPVHWPTARSTA